MPRVAFTSDLQRHVTCFRNAFGTSGKDAGAGGP